MLYADYGFYLNVYKGRDIPSEEEFSRLAVEASAYIDYITHNKLEGEAYPEDIRTKASLAACAVADVCKAELSDSEAVASESVGNHSRSYVNSNRGYANRQREKYGKAALYLRGTGLLYGGLR